jgi:hypothetical protein
MHLHKLKQFVYVVMHMQFVGSILWARDIVMMSLLIKMGQSLISLYSRVMWSPLSTHFQHNWRICLGFTMLTTTMCLQFSSFNIYHPYECHLRGGQSHYAIYDFFCVIHCFFAICLLQGFLWRSWFPSKWLRWDLLRVRGKLDLKGMPELEGTSLRHLGRPGGSRSFQA